MTVAVSSFRHESRRSDEPLRNAVGGAGAREAALRISAIACAAATKRRTSEPQETPSYLSRSGADDSAEEAQALCASRVTAAGLDRGQPGVGTGFCARCSRVRTSDPGVKRGGCVHAGMFGVGSRYKFCQPASDATDQPTFSGMMRGATDRVRARPARKADTERARRKFPRATPRRVLRDLATINSH